MCSRRVINTRPHVFLLSPPWVDSTRGGGFISGILLKATPIKGGTEVPPYDINKLLFVPTRTGKGYVGALRLRGNMCGVNMEQRQGGGGVLQPICVRGGDEDLRVRR